MTPDEIMRFCRENRMAMLFMHRGVADYIAARCCLLSGLFSGFELAAQAVDKILQAYLRLKKYPKPKNSKHALVKYASAVEKICRLDLTPYTGLLERLERYYWARYPDDPKPRPDRMSTGEVDEIDELVFFLIEQYPIPEEVKYTSGLYGHLFYMCDPEQPSISTFPDSHWAMRENKTLAQNLDSLLARFAALRPYG